jgi:hypothetical protein
VVVEGWESGSSRTADRQVFWQCAYAVCACGCTCMQDFVAGMCSCVSTLSHVNGFLRTLSLSLSSRGALDVDDTMLTSLVLHISAVRALITQQVRIDASWVVFVACTTHIVAVVL